jgi:predicted membrane channel-forming protein YqfA (hemolysin III family)
MSSSQVLPIHILIVVVFALVDWIPDRSKTGVPRLNPTWLFVGLVALVLAVFFRQLDVARQFGTPESAIQGHALWHLLTALALGSMYLYYRSERCHWESVRQAPV